MRPNDEILADLRAYIDKGLSCFVFHDSEFLGGAPLDMANRRELLQRIIAELPPVRVKLYCRADTLLRFGDFELPKRAGVASVFIGVESLYQPDLMAFKKHLRVADIVSCVDQLRRLGIYMDLSFIVFHKHASVHSIASNLDQLSMLLRGGSQYLGMPYFSFSFESPWHAAQTAALSSHSYLGWDIAMKEPASTGASFDPCLEPLAEVYRLLAYEWSKKLIEVNVASDHASSAEIERADKWLAGLSGFCLETMRHFLGEFQEGRLTLNTLEGAREDLFGRITRNYEVLPLSLRGPATFSAHASKIDYATQSKLEEPDEYWADAIPLESWESDVMAQAAG